MQIAYYYIFNSCRNNNFYILREDKELIIETFSLGGGLNIRLPFLYDLYYLSLKLHD